MNPGRWTTTLRCWERCWTRSPPRGGTCPSEKPINMARRSDLEVQRSSQPLLFSNPASSCLGGGSVRARSVRGGGVSFERERSNRYDRGSGSDALVAMVESTHDRDGDDLRGLGDRSGANSPGNLAPLPHQSSARPRLSGTEAGGVTAGAGGRTWPPEYCRPSPRLLRHRSRRARGGDPDDDPPPPTTPWHRRDSLRPKARGRGCGG